MALTFGACSCGFIGYVFPAGMYLSAMSVFSSALIAFLFGFGGMLPACVMAVTMIAGGYLAGGYLIPGYLIIIGVFPGAVMIYGSKKGMKFFSQVRNAMIAELLAFVLLLAAIRAYTGQDFASFFKSMFDQMMESLSLEAKNAFAEQLNLLINQQYAGEAIVQTEDILTFFSEGMEQTLALVMPVALVMYSVINGSVGVLWMNWLRKRHGEENVQFVPLRGWRLSKQVTLGLIIVFVAVQIIGGRLEETGLSAQMMVITAIICAAYIQACASFLVRFSLVGMRSGKRVLFLAVVIFIMGVFFPIYGIMSALFGSRGLFMPKVKVVVGNKTSNPQTDDTPDDDKENENSDKNDEEEK